MNNYHLLVIHFPIVFAVMYGIIELISFIWGSNLVRKQIAGWLSLLGLISSIVAQQTGSLIRRSALWTDQQRQLIHAHSNISNLLVWIFGIALVGYVIEFILANGEKYKLNARIGVYLVRTQKIFCSKWLRVLLGIGAIVTVSIVGALGGAVAFGCDIDPLAKILCTFF